MHRVELRERASRSPVLEFTDPRSSSRIRRQDHSFPPAFHPIEGYRGDPSGHYNECRGRGKKAAAPTRNEDLGGSRA